MSAAPRTILFLHSSAGRYGADLQLAGIVAGLDPARYRALCVLPERGRLGDKLEAAGAEVLTRPLAVLRRGLAGPAGMVSIAGGLRRDRRELAPLARERGCALVHSNTSVILGGHGAAERAGIPHLVHVREIYTGSAAPAPLWPLLRRRLLRADALACVSGPTAEQFGSALQAFVLHDGLTRTPARIDRDSARRELRLPGERFVVALLGRISDWKGQDVLARALAEPALADAGAIGVVAGDCFPGQERHEQNLRRLHEELRLGERLRLIGFRDDVETVLGAADAVAVPSTRPDPLPNAALEAAAAGLPIVASRLGGLPEIVRDGETGLLVDPGDPVALAAGLRKLADDPAAAHSLGAAGAADVRARFALPTMLAALQEHYDRLLAQLAPSSASRGRAREPETE